MGAVQSGPEPVITAQTSVSIQAMLEGAHGLSTDFSPAAFAVLYQNELSEAGVDPAAIPKIIQQRLASDFLASRSSPNSFAGWPDWCNDAVASAAAAMGASTPITLSATDYARLYFDRRRMPGAVSWQGASHAQSRQGVFNLLQLEPIKSLVATEAAAGKVSADLYCARVACQCALEWTIVNGVGTLTDAAILGLANNLVTNFESTGVMSQPLTPAEQGNLLGALTSIGQAMRDPVPPPNGFPVMEAGNSYPAGTGPQAKPSSSAQTASLPTDGSVPTSSAPDVVLGYQAMEGAYATGGPTAARLSGESMLNSMSYSAQQSLVDPEIDTLVSTEAVSALSNQTAAEYSQTVVAPAININLVNLSTTATVQGVVGNTFETLGANRVFADPATVLATLSLPATNYAQYSTIDTINIGMLAAVELAGPAQSLPTVLERTRAAYRAVRDYQGSGGQSGLNAAQKNILTLQENAPPAPSRTLACYQALVDVMIEKFPIDTALATALQSGVESIATNSSQGAIITSAQAQATVETLLGRAVMQQMPLESTDPNYLKNCCDAFFNVLNGNMTGNAQAMPTSYNMDTMHQYADLLSAGLATFLPVSSVAVCIDQVLQLPDFSTAIQTAAASGTYTVEAVRGNIVAQAVMTDQMLKAPNILDVTGVSNLAGQVASEVSTALGLPTTTSSSAAFTSMTDALTALGNSVQQLPEPTGFTTMPIGIDYLPAVASVSQGSSTPTSSSFMPTDAGTQIFDPSTAASVSMPSNSIGNIVDPSPSETLPDFGDDALVMCE